MVAQWGWLFDIAGMGLTRIAPHNMRKNME